MTNRDLPTLKDVSRVPEELLPVLRWWQTRGPKTLAYVLGIVIVLGAFAFWFEYRKAECAAVAVALASASQTEDYEAIASSGSSAAGLARLELARSLYGIGEYEESLQVYDTALATLDDPTLKDIAVLGRICALEALERYEEALNGATDLETHLKGCEGTHYLFPDLILLKARLLCQTGERASAKQTLSPLLSAESGLLAKYKSQAERLECMIDAFASHASSDVTPSQSDAKGKID